MQIVDSISKLPKDKKFSLTIGNFDGVHLGHQRLIKSLQKEAEAKGTELVVMTFVPHPLTVLRYERSFLLNSYEERRDLLANLGINFLIEVNFTRDFSTLSPESFMDDFVLCNENVKHLFLGYDFAFGANKKGNHEFVKDYCKDKKIEIVIQEKYQQDDETFSSSLVRESLSKGETEKVISLLGRPYYLKGRVIRGAGRGRQIGFPTANIPIDNYRLPPMNGVYATRCVFRDCSYLSITNVGFNPTFVSEKKLNVETNVFDFDGDLYGEEIKVEFYQKIRDEMKFSSVNDLIEQIKKDVETRRGLDA